MKVKLFFVVPLLFAVVAQAQRVAVDSNWDAHVKSVTLTRDAIELSDPILLLDGDEKLSLHFDVLSDQPETLRYRLQHCNRDWLPDDLSPNEYYSGFEEAGMDDYLTSFNTLYSYIHYFCTFPANYDRFLVSGNYCITVFQEDRPDSILLTRRFRVTEDLLDIDFQVGRPTSGGDIHREQEVSVVAAYKDGGYFSNPAQEIQVVVQQNGRLDLCRPLPFSGFWGNRICYRWKEDNYFPGGNTFRYFDISNTYSPMYNVQRIEKIGGEMYAMLRPDEVRAGKSFSSNTSLNGGMKVNVLDRNSVVTEADYVWVNFSLPMAQPFLGGSVYVVGELTQWRCDDNSRMEWNARYKAYTKRILLKQGYYAYQLLYVPAGGTMALTSTLEGDHSEMPNTYHVYVYLRSPYERYDRLIGMR